jgi:signal transduction histidine kinase
MTEPVPEQSPTVEERMAAVLSTSPVVVSTQDAGLRYTWIHNPLPEFGLEPADFIGRTDAELGRELGATEAGATEIDRMKQRVIDTGRRERRIVDLLTPGGAQVYLDTEVTPTIGAGGEVTGVTSVHVDVTAHHEAALEVAQQRNRLYMLNKELEAFSYSVSHDLRAPLRAIDGFSKALLDDYGEQLGDHGADYLGRVRANAGRMAEQIDDLLELSKVTRGKMERATVDLSALAAEVVRGVAEAEPERRVRPTIPDGLSVEADPRLLRVVLENLIGNAWKFSAGREEAQIEVGSQAGGDGLAYFVRDNGVGFEMKFADKLFGPFQRLHSDEEFEGSGIGLATVQRIVSRHGGRIWAEAEVGEGATFLFTLGEGR